MNLDQILTYQRPRESFYDVLGCDRSSSIEQINREYKIRALQLHPDKNPDPDSLERFRTLQAAKEILSDESARKSYDCWLNSRLNIPFEQWHNRKAHSMMHWATPKSSKLTIRDSLSTGQGSDFGLKQGKNIIRDENLLDKFRKYEI